jgi:hypothetical protein
MDKSQIKNYDELKQKVDKINETILSLKKEYDENNLEQRMYEANEEKYSIQEEVVDAIIGVVGEDCLVSCSVIANHIGLEVESTYWMPSSAIC